METSKWSALIVACGVLVFAGCGSKGTLKTEPVEGIVTLDGKPVEGATVTFVPVREGAGVSATGITDAAGKFSLTAVGSGAKGVAFGSGTMPGEYYVGVMKSILPEAPSEEEEEEGRPASDPGLAPSPEPKVTHVVPPKYNDPKSSGIRVTVKEGKNTIPIELSSR